MKNWAIIKNSEVINSIIWDGVSTWKYPFPFDEIIQSDELQIGMIKDGNGIWHMPEPPPPPLITVTKEELMEKIYSGWQLTEEEIQTLKAYNDEANIG